ncbi:ATP-binding protein [Natrinema ejinorense]|uniref:Helicase HerA central domain-containing protein n=1 Tax=Natrinema ejinorense TaxID=373386 RepID=A0A2A5QPJ2_9EURY|nr:DUF87 domain-containing protein [Natrinema ejinorense]PCR88705.1 hypothetical protein CP557_21740 [Natrinema ejinorense]
MDEQLPVGENDFSLPTVEVLTGRAFITGKSGSGKSNTASVVIEELLEAGYPTLIVDTDGEYYGLKEQYELLHVGADEQCDLRVGPEHAEKLAMLALEDNVPIILDVSGFLDADDANDLIRETARHLFAKEKRLKKPFLLVVEEIHEYIPESGGLDETGQMLVKIAKRGRKHGLGLVGISQRPADVKKDFITQANWLVWHRLTWDNDTKVAGRVLGNDYRDAIAELDDGEAFVQTDWGERIERVQFRRKRTFDAGATPGLEDFDRPELKSISDDLVADLEEISEQEQRRQDRIADLERELADREERIDDLEQELENARDLRDLAGQMADALQNGQSDDGPGENVEQLVAEKNRLERDLAEREDRIAGLESEVESLREELADRPTDADLETAREATERLAEAVGVTTGDESGKWRRKYEAAQERIADLETNQPTVDAPDDYESFVDDEYVQVAIEEAKDEGSPRYVRAVIAGVLRRGGPVTREDIARDIDIQSDSNIEKGIRPLAERGIVTTDGTGPGKQIDFHLENVREIHEQQARKERTEELMDQF